MGAEHINNSNTVIIQKSTTSRNRQYVPLEILNNQIIPQSNRYARFAARLIDRQQHPQQSANARCQLQVAQIQTREGHQVSEKCLSNIPLSNPKLTTVAIRIPRHTQKTGKRAAPQREGSEENRRESRPQTGEGCRQGGENVPQHNLIAVGDLAQHRARRLALRFAGASAERRRWAGLESVDGAR